MKPTGDWTSEFYLEVDGSSPVEEFLDSLDIKTRARFRWSMEQLMKMSMTMDKRVSEGQKRYEDYWAKQMADPEFQRAYEEEAQKKDLWLQLVEARQISGLTQQQVAQRMGVSQAQVARIEKQGYDAYTLRTLRRYIEALGQEFRLEIAVKTDKEPVVA